MSELLWELGARSADRRPDATAISYAEETLSYGELTRRIDLFAAGLRSLGLEKLDRIGVYCEKRFECVVAMFAASRAGLVFVPINPVLKAEQVAYIARDCGVRALVTTSARLPALQGVAASCPDLQHFVVVGGASASDQDASGASVATHAWNELMAGGGDSLHRVIDCDMTAILYTSGSTGSPKGVVLSHRNMVAGARSVASYLRNNSDDRILSVLPLSFDYGLSQLTTGFLSGATVVLQNYLLPRDVVTALARERITGLGAVPPLWIQLAALEWPAAIDGHLRYFTNSGGAMPTATLEALRRKVPSAKPYLMYGLTEAFRSTYLPPEEVDRRPTSIGKAVPNAEILVVRADGSACDCDEPGELVHRGALVSLGYWNDPEKTAARFKGVPGQRDQLVIPETAVWSGDTVRRDQDGFLYFVSRRDEMIKTSGYRVSPTEVEEVLYGSGLVAEAAAFGVDHPALGQAIVVVAVPAVGREPDTKALLGACKTRLPGYMVPGWIDWVGEALPRNANGKIDRRTLAEQRAQLFSDPS